jgi:imidazolonepropionase
MKVYTRITELVTMTPAFNKDGRNLEPLDLGIIQDGAVVFDDRGILWVGPSNELPKQYESIAINLNGHVLTPEIVDSHTHTVFGGDRAQEYADRLNGTSYEEIAKRGGGILFTMNETHKLNNNQLFTLAVERIKRISSFGVGTIEVKSGYGLTYEKEKELTLLVDRLKKHFRPQVQIFNTFMAAHDVPKAFNSSSDYLDQVVIPLLRELAPLKVIDAVDIFHEQNYFSSLDVDRLFNVAGELGINKKIHADELNDNNGAELAVKHRALSADHLLKISEDGISALKSASTVATLLPGTAFFLGKPLAPARKMLDAGVKIAIASDYNPGSSHVDNLLLVASISAAQLKLNQAELWAGITMNGAHALGFKDQGAIKTGLKARFSLFKTSSLSQITYNWGRNFAVTLP